MVGSNGTVQRGETTLWARRDLHTTAAMFNRAAEAKVSVFPEWFAAGASGCVVIVLFACLISPSSLKVELDISVTAAMHLVVSATDLALYQSAGSVSLL